MARPLASYRLKFVAAVSASSLVTLGGALAVISAAVNRDQQRQLDDVLVAEAAEEARELASADEGALLLLGSRRGPEANDVGPLEPYAALIGASGTVIRSSANLDAMWVPKLPRRTTGCCIDFSLSRGVKLRGAWAPVPGRPGQRVLLAVSRADLDGDAAFLRRAMLAVFAVACAWTIGVVAFTITRLTRGYAKVAEVARNVAAGDLDARMGKHLGTGEIAQIARDVDAMIERLGALLVAQRHFVAHAAHELRTPLTVIFGELSLALRKPRAASDYRETIEHALASTRRLKSMADDLLALARLGAEAAPSRAEVSLLCVLEEARDMAAGAATRERIRLPRAEDDRVYGDHNELVRLFRNLLENALRHGPSGTEVNVTLQHEGNALLVAVQDGGVPPVDPDILFEPFRKGATGRQEGSGLGLAIARHIARAHGGDVRLDPHAPTTTFVVELPAGDTPSPSPPRRRAR
ncbi:MAG: HAMP domain-containing histidine kinase [Myxococcales bacterium]|nr:HAMP domain-containing histidine kinase [Myxococcales bacterium]